MKLRLLSVNIEPRPLPDQTGRRKEQDLFQPSGNLPEVPGGNLHGVGEGQSLPVLYIDLFFSSKEDKYILLRKKERCMCFMWEIGDRAGMDVRFCSVLGF